MISYSHGYHHLRHNGIRLLAHPAHSPTTACRQRNRPRSRQTVQRRNGFGNTRGHGLFAALPDMASPQSRYQKHRARSKRPHASDIASCRQSPRPRRHLRRRSCPLLYAGHYAPALFRQRHAVRVIHPHRRELSSDKPTIYAPAACGEGKPYPRHHAGNRSLRIFYDLPSAAANQRCTPNMRPKPPLSWPENFALNFLPIGEPHTSSRAKQAAQLARKRSRNSKIAHVCDLIRKRDMPKISQLRFPRSQAYAKSIYYSHCQQITYMSDF